MQRTARLRLRKLCLVGGVIAMAVPVGASAEVINLPCANFGGSSGLTFPDYPEKWIPLVVLKEQAFPARAIGSHPMFNPSQPDAFYGVCAVVPSKYP